MTVGRGIIDERLNPQITKDLGKPPSASISKSTINPNTQKGSIFIRLSYRAQNLSGEPKFSSSRSIIIIIIVNMRYSEFCGPQLQQEQEVLLTIWGS